MLILARSVQKQIFSARLSNLPSAESRICFESEKIIPRTLSENRILRDGYRYLKTSVYNMDVQ